MALPGTLSLRELVKVADELVSQFLQCLVSYVIRCYAVIADQVNFYQRLMKLDLYEMTEQCRGLGLLGPLGTIPLHVRHGHGSRLWELAEISKYGDDYGPESYMVIRKTVALPFIRSCGFGKFHSEQFR